MDDSDRRLLWHGMFLFLLGLLTGVGIPAFANPRMGLAAHLEGVMNGIFLVVLGAVWARVGLSPRAKCVTFQTALFGTYANWATTSLAAAFGTGAVTPLAAAGRAALPWQEALVTAGFVAVGVAIVAAAVLVLWGLRRHANA
ncbi:MAG: hydrogenase [Acidobacteriota bacterium]